MSIYTPPIAPPPTYPCGHCGTLIPQAQAMRQAGYCGSCELMKTDAVLSRLVISMSTLNRMAARGEVNKIRVTARVLLWRRVEVEEIRAHMEREGRGWIGMLARRTS